MLIRQCKFLFVVSRFLIRTPDRAMLKTTMGMLGEYEYDTVYNDHVVPPVTWVLYVAFLVTNCIIIMNLLVGDDVASCL